MKPLQNLKDTLQRAAGGVADTAQGVVTEAAQKVAEAAQTISGHLGEALGRMKSTVLDGVTYVDNRVQGARTSTANALSVSGDFLGKATMVAGETALLGAGVLPLLFFYDLPIEAGDKVTKTIDGIAKFVRGDRVQFIGINLVGGVVTPQDVRAVIYDPHMPHQDSKGYVQLSEQDITRHLGIMDETRAAREKSYMAALLAVQEARRRYGLPLNSPHIRPSEVVGAAEILLHMAIL